MEDEDKSIAPATAISAEDKTAEYEARQEANRAAVEADEARSARIKACAEGMVNAAEGMDPAEARQAAGLARTLLAKAHEAARARAVWEEGNERFLPS